MDDKRKVITIELLNFVLNPFGLGISKHAHVPGGDSDPVKKAHTSTYELKLDMGQHKVDV